MRILIIDDNPHDAELTQRALKNVAGIKFDYVESFVAFKKVFVPVKYAAIVSDYSLGDCLGTDILQYVRERDPELPFIVVSGTLGEEEVVRVLKLGATDYVLKNKIDKLPITFLRALEEAETRRTAQEAFQRLIESEEKYRLLAEKLQVANKHLTDLSNHLQTIREEERTNIAREIHDELGQQLTALKMDIDWIMHKQTNSDEKVLGRLKEMLKMNEGIINTVRRICSDLRPALIDDLGLIAAIEWKCSDFEERTGVSCQFVSTVKEQKFNKQISINVYRILQETLTNVSRHSEANAVTVLLTTNEKELFLEVMDNGKGISDERLNNSKRLGILGMKERAGLLNGELNINGAENKGTYIKLKLPIAHEYTYS